MSFCGNLTQVGMEMNVIFISVAAMIVCPRIIQNGYQRISCLIEGTLCYCCAVDHWFTRRQRCRTGWECSRCSIIGVLERPEVRLNKIEMDNRWMDEQAWIGLSNGLGRSYYLC